MIWKSNFAVLCGVLVLGGCLGREDVSRPWSYEVVSQFPHDPAAYTQGLQLHEGRLWESTGLYGQSSVREVDPTTGAVMRRRDLPRNLFGEGLTFHNGELWILTWREHTALVLDPETLETVRTLSYEGEGWGLTSDGHHLIMSDGTSTLRFINPADFSVARRLPVTQDGQPVINLNELEYVAGHLFANIYLTDRIVRIDPENGAVTGWVDLSGLRALLPRPHRAEVLNGIAYDEKSRHFLVTGKNWPSLFVLRMRE